MRNKFEQTIYGQLKRTGMEFRYESERIPYILARHYIPDFILTTRSGKIYIECKGYLRPEHKAKMVAVKKQHPERDFRIVFYSRNLRNIKWAEKNGFKYAFEKVPKEWLDE